MRKATSLMGQKVRFSNMFSWSGVSLCIEFPALDISLHLSLPNLQIQMKCLPFLGFACSSKIICMQSLLSLHAAALHSNSWHAAAMSCFLACFSGGCDTVLHGLHSSHKDSFSIENLVQQHAPSGYNYSPSQLRL